MTIVWHEETLWDLARLLFGAPAMVVGFLVGTKHDDEGLMVGTALIIMFIPYASRETVLTLLREDWHMFNRSENKEAPKAPVLSVVDSTDPQRVGLLEVFRGRFNAGDIVSISRIRATRGKDKTEWIEAKIMRDGRESAAGTLVVRNGSFYKDQTVRVESIQGS